MLLQPVRVCVCVRQVLYKCDNVTQCDGMGWIDCGFGWVLLSLRRCNTRPQGQPHAAFDMLSTCLQIASGLRVWLQ